MKLESPVIRKENLLAQTEEQDVVSVRSSNSSLTTTYESAARGQMAYNELSDFPVQEVDPVALVQKNLDHLQELQSRMSFMMREVRYLLRV